MEDRWSEAAARGLDDLGLLVYRSNLLGADPTVVNRGGGNTSVKRRVQDFRGRTVDVLTVKASGYDLRTITAAGFCDVALDHVLPLRERAAMSDEAMVDYLAHCLLEPSAPRPSIETLLHAFLPARHVDHTHADAANALATAARGEEIARELFGEEIVWVPYVRPGFAMAKLVVEAVAAQPRARWVLLQKHGLVTWADDAPTCYRRSVEFAARVDAYLAERAAALRVFTVARPALPSPQRTAALDALLPPLRAALSRERRVVLHVDESPAVLEFMGAAEGRTLAETGLACPDHVLLTKVRPMWVDPPDPLEPSGLLRAAYEALARYEQDYRAYFERNREPGQAMLDPLPRVVLVPGLGMITAGRDAATAATTAGVYHRAIAIMRGASAADRFTSLTEKEAYDVEYWPLELYKLTLQPPPQELAGRIALVTGAAGAIGRGIAARLAGAGAHVVLADLNREAAQAVADALTGVHGPGRALALLCDVTSEESVAAALAATVGAYGGLDILVSNAGYASSYPLEELSLEEWDRTHDVLARGYFLVTREAVKVLRRQVGPDGRSLGGSIVYVASKAGLVPARAAAAYTAAKAAELHLARSVAEEVGPLGIRVNSVAPDAVIEGSGLWAGQWGQARARAHGIALEDLPEFYRTRSLLKQPVTAADVAEAVLFFASDRSAKTTGGILTVDGGLPGGYVR
ncbi:MAG: bifunctional rhamnulose-1-phosphate aldolase/short-chain dehydrogenase [Chloroflexi bacterium]|nr:bifunctional rhamnulose-1-phosphate aldolase/short-chain dehydrogenase [Chloroflexota bacterium]